MSTTRRRLPVEVVIPVRWDGGEDLAHTARVAEMAQYLDRLAQWADVTVVDGSGEQRFLQHQREWAHAVRHCAPAQLPGVNGKVVGAMTGVHLSRHELIVLADDDVRYDEQSLSAVAQALVTADLVRPQNVFSSWPWHARWDAARTLLNRALGSGDWPGTFGVRRTILRATGGWDADVLFENPELVRTVKAAGGRTAVAGDVVVPRLPPDAAHFWSQRVRQAYDDFAQPWRLVPSLAVVPAVVACLVQRRGRALGSGLAVVLLLAEGGRRGALARVVPRDVPLWAPLWVLERGVCSWLAVAEWVRGGVRYHGVRVGTAAHSRREIGRRLSRRPGVGTPDALPSPNRA